MIKHLIYGLKWTKSRVRNRTAALVFYYNTKKEIYNYVFYQYASGLLVLGKKPEKLTLVNKINHRSLPLAYEMSVH